MPLASLFSDHLVLQRDRPVPVWGWSAPGDEVCVTFAGQSKTATAGADGKWTVTLDPLPASADGRTLTAFSRAENREHTVADVLVGDVWLASGQSNMQWRVRESKDADAEAAAADHPRMRLFQVPNVARGQALPDVEAAWQVCGPETAGEFSAVAYFFGRELHRSLGVPVGLIDSSWGGTRIEAWTSRKTLQSDPAGRAALAEFDPLGLDPAERHKREQLVRDPVGWLRERVHPDPGNTGAAKGWAALDHDDADWPAMPAPSQWQSQGHPYSGVFWFRRVVGVPDAWAGKEVVLRLGACDKHDTTYFNGVPVGATGWETSDAWCKPRVYPVPGELVRAGRNVIATRVYSYMMHGGLIGPASSMRLETAGEPDAPPIPLTGPWKYEVEHNFGPQPMPSPPYGPGNPNTPHILYDNMIAPLAPFALRGVIWYQGESNAAGPQGYRTMFPALIADWRRTFDAPALPFFFVQLANYGEPQSAPVEQGSWAELREAQTLTLRVPATGMAVTIDIGEAYDIHPRNKQEVGRRLALAALAQVYGQPGLPGGPLYREHRVEGGAVRVSFDQVGGGLEARGGALKGFAVAGEDGSFDWAEAVISGNAVLVTSARVAAPVAVRYAWANNPEGCNLYNREGLPASPFRTDGV